MVEPDSYAWLEDDESLLDVDGFALVLVESNGTPTDVVAAAGLSARELPAGSDGREVVAGEVAGELTAVDRLGRWLTFLAPNGGLLALAAAPASRAGRVVSFYENINAGMLFAVAEGGSVVRSFDPLLDEPGEGYGPALPEEAGLPFGGIDDPVIAAAFALMERITGERVTQQWFRSSGRPLLMICP